MTKHILFALLLASGCGSVSGPGSSDDVGDDQPDGGMDEPPIDPAVLSIVPAHWKDERLDTIDFTSGEPVHTHQGADLVVKPGAACPAVYRYAYLMDRAPKFGRQTTANAMELEVAVPTIALDTSASTYRLVTKDNAVLIPWTPIGAVPESGRVRIGMYRDAVPELGAYDGELRFDVRVRDTAGAEQMVSACWEHHPLAAPLSIEPAQAALGPTSLMARSLADPASRAIDVLMPTSSSLPAMYSVRLTQQTADSINLGVAPAKPSGTFGSTLAYTYVPTGTVPAPGNCEDFPESCDASPLPAVTTTTASGALTTGSTRWTLIDEVSGEKVPCSSTKCVIPGRGASEAPHAYRLQIEGTDFTNLWHQVGTVGGVRDLTVPAGQVIGLLTPLDKIQRCTRFKTIGGITACMTLVEYARLTALDRATLALAPLSIQIEAGSDTIARRPVPYLPGGALTTSAITWDGGDGPL